MTTAARDTAWGGSGGGSPPAIPPVYSLDDFDVAGDLLVRGGQPWFDVRAFRSATDPDFSNALLGARDAVIAATRGSIFVPPGIFPYTVPLSAILVDGLSLFGAGSLVTELQYQGATAAPLLDVGDNVTQRTDTFIGGFRIRDYANTATRGLRARKVNRLALRDVNIVFDQTGSTAAYLMDLTTVYWGHFENVHMSGAAAGILATGCKGCENYGGSYIAKTLGSGIGCQIDSTTDTFDFFGTDFENWLTGQKIAGKLCRTIGGRFDGVTNEYLLDSGALYNWLGGPSTSKSPASGFVVTDNSGNTTNTYLTPGHFHPGSQAAAVYPASIRLLNNVSYEGLNTIGNPLGLIKIDTNNHTYLPQSVYSGGAFFPQDTAVGIYAGSGSPEGVVTANVGSIYLRSDGGVGTTLYKKTSGSGNTGWTAS